MSIDHDTKPTTPRRVAVWTGTARDQAVDECVETLAARFSDWTFVVVGGDGIDTSGGVPWLGVALGGAAPSAAAREVPELGSIELDARDPGVVTVRRISAGEEAGEIVREEALTPEPFETRFGRRARRTDLAERVLCEVLADLHRGAAPSRPRGSAPVAARDAAPGARGVLGGAREVVKRAVLLAYVHVWARARNAWRARRGRCHTAIVVYHRVSDRFRDAVTVGVEQFDRQIRLLSRHYDVLSLETWLAERGMPRTRPAVVFNFDDGYADNHLAARLLRRADAPCTFFLCTRIVGTQDRFPQDVQKDVHGAPPLTWEQIDDMSRWGMRFGNHTMHHANLGKLPHDEAIREVRDAAADLVERLPGSGAEKLLAYPYGRQGDITERVRGELPGLGIEWCLSAYGGVNSPDFDPLNVLRLGVSYNVSDIALRALVEGWRSR